MRRTIVNARGQVTIPAELRKQIEIKPATASPLRITLMATPPRTLAQASAREEMRSCKQWGSPIPAKYASAAPRSSASPAGFSGKPRSRGLASVAGR
jgi:bifunctional DNA-binding transcriptional regulator/antitoxin component of YhaV-PrlF toxin-antitoxin module